MKRLYKKKWFWPTVFVIIVFVAIIIASNRTIDGTKGGLLEGASHRNGGIKGRLKSTGETIEMQGTESIINGNSMQMNERVVCEGTPAGVASAVNELGGGVEFNRNGSCIIKN